MRRPSARGIARVATLAVAILGFGLGGCQTTEKPEPAPTPSRTDSEFKDAPIQRSDSAPTKRAAELSTVYFDFDKYNIRPDARETLRSNYEIIMGNGSGPITIQGNTDERGTEEYNLALGERRATAVKRYLVNLGVPASRLHTVSFGESRPAVRGHDESAWRYNRRSDFVVGR